METERRLREVTGLSIFNLVAGTASIIALLVVLLTTARKVLQTTKQKRQRAQQELANQLDLLRAAGGSVSARSDLGFFVLVQLGSLRDSASSLRHVRAVFLICMLVGLLTAVVVLQGPYDLEGKAIAIAFGVVGLGMYVAFMVVTYMLVRLENYTESYEDGLKQVWARPVTERAKRSIDPESRSP